MPPICTICRHERQAEIDQQLLAGTSLRNIAKRYGTSATALHRHKQHIAEHLVTAKEAAQAADAGTLLDQVKRLLVDAQRLTTQAEHAKQLDVALRGIREVRGVLELLGKVSSELAAQQAAKEDPAVTTSSVREKLRAKLMGPSSMSAESAVEFVRDVCRRHGLALMPVVPDPAEENERRIAELMGKAGASGLDPIN